MTTKGKPGPREILYSICPVGNASYIAASKGWLVEGLAAAGAAAVKLQTLPQDRWKVHFTYEDPALFREGGNIPPIWAKSRGAEPVLLGWTFLTWKQSILVRADSPLQSVEQLRHKRLGVTRSANALIDFWKATIERGFETALMARGLIPAEVDFIEILVEQGRGHRETFALEALKSGRVDAVYYGGTWVQSLLDSGRVRSVFEFSADPSLIWPISNENPIVLTVSRKLAEEAPEVVVAYLKQIVKAAEWARTNRAEVETIFAEQTSGTPAQVAAARPADFHLHLAPQTSGQGLLALESQKRFLLDHGYIERDFALEKWLDSSFLNTAIDELQRAQTTAV
ncbi:ABC-type nitrate/sulfonate/bicarbonate transport system substrate-binding protein [Hydrogenispora ethanolica]|uniref:ABC-type nitrate/sulfonate/bicarbonate transport system substrate-binding protein n=1 Tax=Hydrogenispora ethanolica TaxID=1082276 RepID=A0A4R1QXY1_HYDET|nr:ABC transporter substrate-binding protein [Hydrogenispora ethanolica]TCL56470.1 ABC-type nitrate/sulfonate/bicarbonate transport system substrate-binding protein [Hydrogenispora ethanolica]